MIYGIICVFIWIINHLLSGMHIQVQISDGKLRGFHQHKFDFKHQQKWTMVIQSGCKGIFWDLADIFMAIQLTKIVIQPAAPLKTYAYGNSYRVYFTTYWGWNGWNHGYAHRVWFPTLRQNFSNLVSPLGFKDFDSSM